jgi:F-type H+-transporting ATPase subunit a
VLETGKRDQIRQVSRQNPGRYLPFVGSLFLYVAMANLLNVVPGYMAPTGSLSTTTALAICVFIAVPLYGIVYEGPVNYLKHYVKPTPLMLPFNIIGELSRTLALAVRLYGNIMSGTVVVAILLSLTPYFFPVVMELLGLLTGMIQAYIFAILAMVYIASATSAHSEEGNNEQGSSHTETPGENNQTSSTTDYGVFYGHDYLYRHGLDHHRRHHHRHWFHRPGAR